MLLCPPSFFQAVTIETNVFTPLTSDIVFDDLLTNISYLQWKLCMIYAWDNLH